MRSRFALLVALLPFIALADQRAITDTGDEVMLQSNGTWKYLKASPQSEQTAIETNRQRFTKPVDNSFQLKSTRNNLAIWINPTKWSFSKATNGESAEYRLRMKQGDLYAMAICEGIEIASDSLLKIALQNAKKASPDVQLVKQEYRIVNGVKVIYAEMSGTMEGVSFTYFGYYHSDSKGSTQLVSYTANNLITKYRSDIDDFLNGFTLQN